jgi:hypothetical protein
VAAALLVHLAGGCYRPSIVDGSDGGGLLCAVDPDPCPDGFSCVLGRCWRGQWDAGMTAIGAAGPDVSESVDLPRDESAELAPSGGACVPNTTPPVTDCHPQSGLACDPVCQTGCCAGQKCSTVSQSGVVNSLVGKLGCVPFDKRRAAGEPCSPMNLDSGDRSDDCLPGLVCIVGDFIPLCFPLCRRDDDCPEGGVCEERATDPTQGFLASVCSLPRATCNPIAMTGCSAGRSCYLTGFDPVAGDTTICDIVGSDRTNGACAASHECIPGYTCPTVGPGALHCRRLCARGVGSQGCPAGPSPETCLEYGQLYGYCN